MILLMIFIGMVIGYLSLHVGSNAIDHFQKKAIEKKKLELEVKTDEDGCRVEYDPHFTRKMEIAEGLSGVLTQCSDTECTTCYWKPRNKVPVDGAFSATNKHAYRLNSYIDSLPDGLSDENYDIMVADFKASYKAGLEKAKAQLAAKEEAKILADRERYYSTPNHLIEKYLAEGRTFDKNGNSWSNPKGLGLGSTSTVISGSSPANGTDVWLCNDPDFNEVVKRNRAHWAKRHPNHYKPSLIKFVNTGHVDLNDYRSIMEQSAGKDAVMKAAAFARDINSMLIKAKLENDKEKIVALEEDLKIMTDRVKRLREEMKEWRTDVQQLKVRVRANSNIVLP